MLDCGWRMEAKRSIVVGSLETHRGIESRIREMVGLSIRSITFIGRIPEIVIQFGNGTWLQSFSTCESEDWGVIFREGGAIGRKGCSVSYEAKQR